MPSRHSAYQQPTNQKMNTANLHKHLLEIADRVEIINLHLGSYADDKGAMSIFFDALEAAKNLQTCIAKGLLQNGLAERQEDGQVLRLEKPYYKIQILAGVSDFWGDLKLSEEGGPYMTHLFEAYEDALNEVAELNQSNPDTEYRIVPELTPSDVDLY